MNSSISSSKALIAAFLAAGAGVFALLASASEWLVRAQAAPADTLAIHVGLLNNATTPYAAFGDSHVARGFDAKAPVVNLAYPSENIEKMSWETARYLEHAGRPEIVLIQADAHLFAPYRTEKGLEDYPQLFAKRKRRGSLALSGRYRPQLVALWRSFIINGGRLRSTIEPTPQGALLSPGNIAHWRADELERFAKFRVALHRPAPGFSNSKSADLYKDMIAAFLARGTRVCLAAMPTAPVYRAAIDASPAEDKRLWKEAEAFFKALADNPGVRYIDHRDLYADLNLFRDPDHLNKTGARRYGPVLQEACFGDAARDEAPAAIAQATP